MADVIKVIRTNTGASPAPDYTTWQAWEDAVPADTTTQPGEDNYIGEGYNDSEFTASFSSVVNVSGHTTSSSHKIILRAASGQGWNTHADVRTRPLRYDASYGVCFRKTANYSGAIEINGGQHVEVTGIMIKCEHSSGIGLFAAVGGTGSPILGKDLFIETNGGFAVYTYGTGGLNPVLANVLMFSRSAGGNGARVGGTTLIGCAVIRASDQAAAGTGLQGYYNNNTLISCAIFGYTTAVQSGHWDTGASKNNATDQAAGLPGSSNQHSVTFSQLTPYVDADKDSLDLRSIASTTLAANGFYDATYPLDISGYTRANPPTIGHWEITAGGGPTGNPWYYYAQQ